MERNLPPLRPKPVYFEEDGSNESADKKVGRLGDVKAKPQLKIEHKSEQEEDFSSDHFLTVSEYSSSSVYDDSGMLFSFKLPTLLAPDSEEWIQWHCNRKGNEFLCEVEHSYIMDDFNLHDLKHHF